MEADKIPPIQDLTTPTFSCYMRANPFSKEKAEYLKQHQKRMQEFANKPYFRHIYPCIPAHYPGTWKVYNWDQIDSVVDRLYYVPDRWTQEFQRREEMRELIARQVAGPDGVQEKKTRGHKISAPTHQAKPRAQSAPVVGRRVDENGLLLRTPDKREPERKVKCQRGSSATILKHRPVMKVSPLETSWGHSTSNTYNADHTKTKRLIDINENPGFADKDSSGKATADHTNGHVLNSSVGRPVSKHGVRFSEMEQKKSEQKLQVPPESIAQHSTQLKNAENTDSDDKNNYDDSDNDNTSVISRPRSSVSTKSSEKRKWSFSGDDVEAVTSSVMSLLQQIHATNGRIRPSSAMVNYREKMKKVQEQRDTQ